MSMVSGMESSSARQDLAAAERAAAAPYVDYPATPRWYPPVLGAWTAALVAALTMLDGHPVVRGAVLVALVAMEGGFFGWYRVYRGTMPSLRHAPREINDELRRYVVVVVLMAGAVVAAALLLPDGVAPVLAFMLVTAGAAAYERRYARAAEATRARLG
jgi:hypothetical protein